MKKSVIDCCEILKTLGEPTRLRALMLLRHCDLTVGELTELLDQTQPGVSRHMKFLVGMGLVERVCEGSWVFYRKKMSDQTNQLMDALLALIDDNDPVIAEDINKLDALHHERSREAQKYFSEVAENWDEISALEFPHDSVSYALLDIVEAKNSETLIDIGTGSGRIVKLFSPHVETAIGLDNNHPMLKVARSNLSRSKAPNAVIQHYDVLRPANSPAPADIVVMYNVLHYLHDPQKALNNAKALLKPAGRLVIADYLSHQNEELRQDPITRRLGFSRQAILNMSSETGLKRLRGTQISAKTTSSQNHTGLKLQIHLFGLEKSHAA